MNNWATLQAASNDGFEIGNHTKSHPSLATLTDANMDIEIGGAHIFAK